MATYKVGQSSLPVLQIAALGSNASSYNEKSERFYVWRGHNTEEREKELPTGHKPGKATAEEPRFQKKPSTGSSGPEILSAAGGSKHAANVKSQNS